MTSRHVGSVAAETELATPLQANGGHDHAMKRRRKPSKQSAGSFTRRFLTMVTVVGTSMVMLLFMARMAFEDETLFPRPRLNLAHQMYQQRTVHQAIHMRKQLTTPYPRPSAETCWKTRPFAQLLSSPVDQPLSIIPLPHQMHCTHSIGGFKLDEQTKLYHTVRDDAVETFRKHVRLFFDLELEEVKNRSHSAKTMLVLKEDPTLPAEGYSTHFGDERGRTTLFIGISKHNGRASILHALQSFRQLLHFTGLGPEPGTAAPKSSHPLIIPRCTIRDYPRHRWRGVMLDVARNFFDVATVKRLMMLMSYHKLNVLHLHLSDDQGWRIEVKGHPELANIGGARGASLNRPQGDGNGERIYNGSIYSSPQFYTQADIREIVSFAADLGIDVVPEIDVPAHTAALIVAARTAGLSLGTIELHEGCADRQDQSKLTAPPNCMGGTHGIIVPTKEALEYVKSIVSEIAELFPSKYFHLGGDEADQFRDSVYSTPEAEKLKQDLGLTSSAALQGYFVDEVYKVLKSKGKTVIAWDETHLGLEGYHAPDDMVLMWWRDFHYEASWPNVLSTGKRMIMAPQGKMYLDIYQMEPHSASCFRAQEGTMTLLSTYSAAELDSKNALGVHAALWTEQLKSREAVEYQMFPRGAAAAEVGWTTTERTNFVDFLKRWDVHKERLAYMGVQYYDGPYSGQIVRRSEIEEAEKVALMMLRAEELDAD